MMKVNRIDNCSVATPQARILVVNDRVEDLIFLTRSLTSHGHHIQIARSVRQAQELCKDTPPDIVLWDLALLTSLDYREDVLLHEENCLNIPILFTSSSTEPSIKMKSLEMRGVHLARPFDEEDVLMNIEVLLAWQDLREAS